MLEITIPDEGVVVRTESGRPVLELSVLPEGNVLRLFAADGDSRIVIATHLSSSLVLIGDIATDGVGLSVEPDATRIVAAHEGKTVATGISAEHSELRFANEADQTTIKVFVTDRGGQLGLSDHEGTLQFSAGADLHGGVLHVMSNAGETAVLADVKDGYGNITLLKPGHEEWAFLGQKTDPNLRLVDSEGRTRWSTNSR